MCRYANVEMFEKSFIKKLHCCGTIRLKYLYITLMNHLKNLLFIPLLFFVSCSSNVYNDDGELIDTKHGVPYINVIVLLIMVWGIAKIVYKPDDRNKK